MFNQVLMRNEDEVFLQIAIFLSPFLTCTNSNRLAASNTLSNQLHTIPQTIAEPIKSVGFKNKHVFLKH